MDKRCKWRSPLGDIYLTGTESGLTGLWFSEEKAVLKAEASAQPIKDAIRWLETYFGGSKPEFLPKLELSGSIFQKKVWQMLLDIEYGAVTSYGAIGEQIAKQNGGRMSAQAVGGAVGKNPVSIIVPCHRVVGKNGSLVGYTGGMDKKIALLQLEGCRIIGVQRIISMEK